MTRLYNGCAFFMMTSTTMVLLILVETTWPILVARRLCFVVVSAIYFFLVWLADVFFLALAAGFPFPARLFLVSPAGSATAAAVSGISAFASAWAALTMPSFFSRIT